MSPLTAREHRYFWSQGTGEESTYSLIDRISSKEVATIVYLKSVRRWQWSRHTTALLHGAVAVEGTSKLLAEAKRSIEAGLPQEM